MRISIRRFLVAGLVLAAAVVAVGARADPACHGAPTGVRLFVDVPNVKSDHGFLVANIYGDDRRRWLAENGWLDVWRDPAERGAQTMCMYLPRPGIYEVVMFQDANSNGDLDLGLLGPTEGYGFSNNVRPFLRAPSMKSASFYAGAGDTRLQIRLRYL